MTSRCDRQDSRLAPIAVAGDLFEYEGDWNDNSWRAWSKDPSTQEASRRRVLALADYIIPGHGDRFKVPSGAADIR